MKLLARFFLLVFAVAMFWGLSGCASSKYEKGIKHYRPDDVAAAVRELKPLAEQGNAEAQFKLGSLYYQGWGVSQDYREAVKWLRKAAEQDHIFSQTTLGTVYADGVGGVVEKDYPQALMWFIFAAAKGDMEAMEFRDTLANRMMPSQIAEAQKLARDFKPQDAYTKSLEELKTLAVQGDATDQFKIGLIYYKGQGVPSDYLEALGWFKKAALQGHPLGQYNVGYMYEKGEGTAQDYVEAARYYRQAAEQGNQLAQYNLGSLYERGHGIDVLPQVEVKPDEVKALAWYNLAAIRGEAKAKAARDRIMIWMNPKQIAEARAEAQRLAREFKIVGK